MSTPQETEDLGPLYYLVHFRQMTGHIRALYEPILPPSFQAFLTAFEELSEPEQCLFLRMANRKNVFFRWQTFSYPEIEHLPEALAGLEDKGFITSAGLLRQPEDRWRLPHALTRPVLEALFPEVAGQKVSKVELVEQVARGLEGSVALPGVVRQLYEEEMSCARLLYFGHPDTGAEEFVIHWLGHGNFEAVGVADFTPRFHATAEITDSLQAWRLYQTFRVLREWESAEEVAEWLAGQLPFLRHVHEVAAPFAERLLGRVGQWLEKQGRPDLALTPYALACTPPARERCLRLLDRAGRTAEARAKAGEMASQPFNPAEYFAATDYLRKLEGRKTRNQTTEALARAEVLHLDCPPETGVELAVLAHFRQQGWEGFFSENYLWNNLFGLLFWDLIFDERAIHQPFQRAPSDLGSAHFFGMRQQGLALRCAELAGTQAMQERLLATFQIKQGVLNPFVHWHPAALEQALAAVAIVPPEQILAVLMEIARNPAENTRGFPDLFRWKGEEYCFTEVKSANDHLSAHQLYWQEFFKGRGLKVEVLRVLW